jgi:hypothetical protein
MRNRSLPLLTALVFAFVACSSDDAATVPETQSSESTELTTTAPATTAPTQSTIGTEVPADDTTVPSTSVEPPSDVEVFSFAEHDLCEWLTPERIAEFVAAEYDWDGTAVEYDAESGFPPPGGCGWVLSGDDGDEPVEFPNVVVWDGSSMSGETSEVIDYQDLDIGDVEIGQWVAGHPALADGAWFALSGWGFVLFGFPDDGRVIEMMLEVPGNRYGSDPFTSTPAVADRIMRELGWTS